MTTAYNQVADVMTTSPFSVSPNESIERAAGLLLRASHSGCAVCDADGVVVGVLSELDLMRALMPNGEETSGALKVQDFMTATPVMLRADMPLDAAAQFFLDIPIRRAPIVDAQGVLVGICSRRDVLRALTSNARERRCQ